MKTRVLSPLVLVGAVVAGYLMTGQVSAQGSAESQGNPTILAAVHEIQHTLVNFQATLSELQTAIDALGTPAAGNVRWTPALNANSEAVTCAAFNVSDTPRKIRLELLGVGAGGLDETFEVAAGSTLAATKVVLGFVHCKFTVVDGTIADIRGSIVLANAAGKMGFAAE
jgi:hypothetical protein